MARFFTADWHLGSFNIINYAKRPFFTATDAATKLVDGCNEVARQKTDVVFHVGDFWLKNKDRHDDTVDENTLAATYNDYIRFINARLVLFAGNHDDIDTVDCKSMMVELNQNYRNVFVTHLPSDVEDTATENNKEVKFRYHGPVGSDHNIQINLCGHVHNSWLLKFDAKRRVLNYNVGCDVHDYKPVKDSEITEDLDFIFKYLKNFTFTFALSRDKFEQLKKTIQSEIKRCREERKQEKYKRLGLTPEERERRKIEAMKKKGLI